MLKNIIANYGSKVWSFLSIFIFIPLYIKYLGIESYAVIGFYSLILGVISFADAGLSSAVTREFAKSSDGAHKYSILIIIERMYFLICVVVGFVIFFFAPLIASKWLTSNVISVLDLTYYVRLIGFGVVTQLFSTMFFGGLVGLHAQVSANITQVIWSFLKNFGVIIIFMIYKPSLEIFFLWQLLCNIIYIIGLRYLLINILKSYGSELVRVLKVLPKDVWTYIGGMTLVAIISSINIQADKIITSSLFTLKQFGHYTLASTLSQLPVLLGTPLVITIFPTLTKLVSDNNIDLLKKNLNKFSFLLSILVFPISISLLLYTSDLIILWTGNKTFSKDELIEVIVIVRWLTLGSMFLSLQMIPFYFLLAKGKTKYTVYQGVIQVIFSLPALYFSVQRWGLLGAGIPWFIINISAFLFLIYIVYVKEIEVGVLKFLGTTIVVPFIVNGVVFGLFYLVFSSATSLESILLIICSGIFSLVFNIIWFNLRNGEKALSFKNLFST